MKDKAVLVDQSKCIACRSCQVACKQWNKLPAEKTEFFGGSGYQNPADLSAITYTVIRFNEKTESGETQWSFLKNQCRHCLEPACKEASDEVLPGAVEQDATGAVVYTEKTRKLKKLDLTDVCPFNIPRRDSATGQWSKCTFCRDRIADSKEPACVKACPTGTLTFGDRDQILNLAQQRCKTLQTSHPHARIINAEDVRWIHLLIT